MQEKTLPAVIESIPQVIAWVDEVLEKLDCPMKAQMQIDVAVDEIFANIANYAYPDQEGTATVRLDFEEETRTLSIIFIDQGQPFDPLNKEDPDVSLSAEERVIGGLGIFLVKKTMDDMSYQYKDGCNILSLKKRV